MGIVLEEFFYLKEEYPFKDKETQGFFLNLYARILKFYTDLITYNNDRLDLALKTAKIIYKNLVIIVDDLEQNFLLNDPKIVNRPLRTLEEVSIY